MKKIALSLILFFCFCPLSFSQTKEIQFRLVLTQKEAEAIPFDSYIDRGGREIAVSREVLLSNKDIKSMSVSKDSAGEYRVLVKFTDAGKDKFYEVTGKNINRQLAVVVGEKVLADPIVTESIHTGQTFFSVDSLSEGEELIQRLGFTPSLEYQF